MTIIALLVSITVATLAGLLASAMNNDDLKIGMIVGIVVATMVSSMLTTAVSLM